MLSLAGVLWNAFEKGVHAGFHSPISTAHTCTVAIQIAAASEIRQALGMSLAPCRRRERVG